MKNEIRISTFGIRHEVGEMFVGYRAADGTIAMQQVTHGPAQVTLAQIPARIHHGFGVSSVELMEQNLQNATDADLEAFKKALEEEGVTLGLLGLSRAAGDANPVYREEDLTALEELIDVAASLGAQQVRVVLMPPPIVPLPEPASFDELVAALRRLAARADAAGVRLMVENDDAITADPSRLVPILEEVGTDVGLVLDTGNIEPVMSEITDAFMTGREAKDVDAELTYQVIESLLPRAEVVHVKTYGFKEDGSSKVYDLNRVIKVLVDGGFEGPLTIEYAGAEGPEADIAIARTIELLRAA